MAVPSPDNEFKFRKSDFERVLTQTNLTDTPNILANKDCELIGTLKDATLAASQYRNTTAMLLFGHALKILNELDPDHSQPMQWAETFEQLSQTALAFDNQLTAITYQDLALKEYLRIPEVTWQKVMHLSMEILGNFCEANVPFELTHVAIILLNTLDRHWDELTDNERFDLSLSLTDWLHRVDNKALAHKLNDTIAIKTFGNQIGYDSLAPLDHLLIGRVASLEGQPEVAVSWIRKACQTLENLRPFGFARSLALFKLAEAELDCGNLEAALNANNMALSAIDTSGPKVSRLLCEGVQIFVDTSIRFAEFENGKHSHWCLDQALALTEEHAELSLAHEYCIALQTLKIELFLKEDNLEAARDALSKLPGEIRGLGRVHPDKSLARAKYRLLSGELARREGDPSLAINYFERALYDIDNDGEQTNQSIYYREAIIAIYRSCEQPLEALNATFQLEKFILSRLETPEPALSRVRCAQGKLYAEMGYYIAAADCYLSAVGLACQAPLHEPSKYALPSIYQAVCYFEERYPEPTSKELGHMLSLSDKGLSLIANIASLNLIPESLKDQAGQCFIRIKLDFLERLEKRQEISALLDLAHELNIEVSRDWLGDDDDMDNPRHAKV